MGELPVIAAQSSPSPAPPPRAPLLFERYAADFSQAAGLSPAADPQVFVQDASVTAGSGPQQIPHVAGLRNARISDPGGVIAFDAAGASLGFSLGQWFGARGSADIVRRGNGGDRVTAAFEHLISFGVYSLFVVTYGNDGPVARPLDNDGTANGFTADIDGDATVAIDSPRPLGASDAIVLVYHSDSTEHGLAAGTSGVDAHVQLIARVTTLAAS